MFNIIKVSGSQQLRRIAMLTLFAIGVIFATIFLLIKFAQQEAVEEFYQAAIIDIEGRMDWARSRSSCPFGMKTNIENSNQLLYQAKDLWHANRYHQAYRVARQSQDAIDKAQKIYISANVNARLSH